MWVTQKRRKKEFKSFWVCNNKDLTQSQADNESKMFLATCNQVLHHTVSLQSWFWARNVHTLHGVFHSTMQCQRVLPETHPFSSRQLSTKHCVVLLNTCSFLLLVKQNGLIRENKDLIFSYGHHSSACKYQISVSLNCIVLEFWVLKVIVWHWRNK